MQMSLPRLLGKNPTVSFFAHIRRVFAQLFSAVPFWKEVGGCFFSYVMTAEPLLGAVCVQISARSVRPPHCFGLAARGS